MKEVEEAKVQVEQVTDIMKGNLDKIMERDGKLQDLELKADKLQVESQQFQVTNHFYVPEPLLLIAFFRKL